MISFVYFDLGGVVIQDFSGTNKWEELKKELGVTKKNYEDFEKLWSQYHDEINIDRDVDSLIPIFNKELGLKIPNNYSLLTDGFVNRFEKVIKEIQRVCKVGLLTNMYPGMFSAINKRGILPDINWEVIVDSTVVGYQKPDSEIYEIAERKANIKGSEILFIENTSKNIKAAESLGWQTFLYDSSNPNESSRNLMEFFLNNSTK